MYDSTIDERFTLATVLEIAVLSKKDPQNMKQCHDSHWTDPFHHCFFPALILHHLALGGDASIPGMTRPNTTKTTDNSSTTKKGCTDR